MREIKEKYIREIGKEYGRLTIIDVYKSIDGSIWCRCKCKCGNEVVRRLHNVLSGRSRSCGCLHRESFAKMRERSKAKNEWIIDEIKNGKSISEISRDSGFSRQTISGYVQQYRKDGRI